MARIILISFLLFFSSRTAPDSAYPPAHIGKWDAEISQGNINKTICKSGYTSVVRDGKGNEFGAVTESIKRRVYERDSKTPVPNHCCEIDHAFPLELGGANVIHNLWAESWDGQYGARAKDRVETTLHRMVCATLDDPLPLRVAQKCLESDWVRCGKQIGVLR